MTAALISDGERLFIARRPPHKSAGLLWEFPGGKVEGGESLEESLEREIREELCWEVRVEELFQRVSHFGATFGIELFAFWCTIQGGQLCLRDHISSRWVRPDELSRFDFTPADLQLVRSLEKLALLPGKP